MKKLLSMPENVSAVYRNFDVSISSLRAEINNYSGIFLYAPSFPSLTIMWEHEHHRHILCRRETCPRCLGQYKN